MMIMRVWCVSGARQEVLRTSRAPMDATKLASAYRAYYNCSAVGVENNFPLLARYPRHIRMLQSANGETVYGATPLKERPLGTHTIELDVLFDRVEHILDVAPRRSLDASQIRKGEHRRRSPTPSSPPPNAVICSRTPIWRRRCDV